MNRPLSEYTSAELEERKANILGNVKAAEHTKLKVRIPDLHARVLAIDRELEARREGAL